MNKIKIITIIAIALSILGNIYFFGGKIYNDYNNKLIQQGREEMFSIILLQIKNTGQVRLNVPLDSGELGTVILAPVIE